MKYISAVVTSYLEEEDYEEYCVFDLNKMNRKFYSMNMTKKVVVIVSNYEVYIRTSYVPDINNLKGLERHTDVNTYDLSNLLGIRLVQDTKTLNNYDQISFI